MLTTYFISVFIWMILLAATFYYLRYKILHNGWITREEMYEVFKGWPIIAMLPIIRVIAFLALIYSAMNRSN